MKAVLAGEALLERFDPEIVVFNEKGYAGFGSIYDVALARGANVIQFVAAGIHWRDALLFKRYTEETRRLHPASLSRDSWEIVRQLPWTEARERELREEFDLRYGGGEMHPDAGLQEGKRIVSGGEVRARLGLDPAKPTAVIFSHVLWDANLFYGDDLFEDQETWLVESVRAASENPRANWVVKLHPANMYKAIRTVGPAHCTLSSDAGEPLFPNSVESLRLLRGYMSAFGCTEDEIYTMSTANPAFIVGLNLETAQRASAAR